MFLNVKGVLCEKICVAQVDPIVRYCWQYTYREISERIILGLNLDNHWFTLCTSHDDFNLICVSFNLYYTVYIYAVYSGHFLYRKSITFLLKKNSIHILDIFGIRKLQYFFFKKKFRTIKNLPVHIPDIFRTFENFKQKMQLFFRTKNGHFPDIVKYTRTNSGHFWWHFPDNPFL